MEQRSTQQARRPDQSAVNLLGSILLTVLRRTTIVRVFILVQITFCSLPHTLLA